MISLSFIHQAVNPDLTRLQPYPFEKLHHLFAGASPAPALCGPSSMIAPPVQ
jgi:hypothetical protein